MAGDIGYGAKIAVNDGVSAAYVDFTNVTQITSPAQEEPEVESTHLASPNRTREYVPGLIEPGECSFTQRYTAVAYDRALTLKGVSHTYKITYPDAATSIFSGYLKKAELEVGAAGDIVDIKVTLKVTGDVTFDATP